MIKDVLTAASTIQAENGEQMELTYHILTSESAEGNTFALRVDKREKLSGRLLSTEASLAFSDNFDYIQRVAELFAKGQVTPGVLTEMCDEVIY